ncbi:MAG: hypothetical protein GC131_08970 [Alphaproteobacteria bacterium]|nr:hypothetical protein [Alphaproteobacteria bacterium]
MAGDSTTQGLQRLRRKHAARPRKKASRAKGKTAIRTHAGIDPGLPIATLIELMTSSDSDSARIAAAKVLLDRSWKEGGNMAGEQDDQGRQDGQSAAGADGQERLDVIAAISRLLDELAAAKAARDADAAGVDKQGPAKPASTGG